MQYLKIPHERVGALIGVGGAVRKEIEKRTGTAIKIEEGDVSIEGEGLGSMTAKDVVLAIGRGFSPEVAFNLFREEHVLEIIPLSEMVGTEKEMARAKGRIIGTKGKTRAVIEGVTRTSVSVYGKSVAIIGRYDEVQTAKEAVVMLARGTRHSSVYRFLEKSRMGQNEIDNYEIPSDEGD
jgi:ribosomal RNA assembly protein